MSHVNTYGMVLYLVLAIFGGFLTGLFSHYVYHLALAEFKRSLARLFAALFYIAPLWAVLSLFKDDDLDIFYVLLIVSFAFGVYFYSRINVSEKTTSHHHYFPPDED